MSYVALDRHEHVSHPHLKKLTSKIEDKKIKSFCEDNLLGAINKCRIIDMTSF
ncbi:hypothetical protein A0O32_0303 [Anoxybacillus flavithermus]|nr:hypothetical protein A0O32_0303 [Anoxybacillus flavithermus]